MEGINTILRAADAAQKYPWWTILGAVAGVVAWLWWRRSERREKSNAALRKTWLEAALRAAEDEDTEAFLRIATAIGLASRSYHETRNSNCRTSSRASTNSEYTNAGVDSMEHNPRSNNNPDSSPVGDHLDSDRCGTGKQQKNTNVPGSYDRHTTKGG